MYFQRSQLFLKENSLFLKDHTLGFANSFFHETIVDTSGHFIWTVCQQ